MGAVLDKNLFVHLQTSILLASEHPNSGTVSVKRDHFNSLRFWSLFSGEDLYRSASEQKGSTQP